jgi:hypothetical protein
MKSINVMRISTSPSLLLKNHLCFKISLHSTHFKPSNLVGLFNQYDPLKMLDIDPKTMPNFHAHFVTPLDHDVTNSFSNDEKKTNNGEILK